MVSTSSSTVMVDDFDEMIFMLGTNRINSLAYMYFPESQKWSLKDIL